MATLPLLFGRTEPLRAEDSCTLAGRLTSRATWALDDSSINEDPSLSGRLAIDAQRGSWHLYSWLEGGWDGTVRGQSRNHAIVKGLGAVYQDSTPYLEAKDLYAERTYGNVDARIGIQRFAWGRLDEYPVNDLFNPWDYRQFLMRSLEERKIGVPAVSAAVNRLEWTAQLVWVPWLVPYRLPEADERWSLDSACVLFPDTSIASVTLREPGLPARELTNGSVGLRWQLLGEVEWALNLFHGFDPRPVFRTTALNVIDTNQGLAIDPGFVPSFNKITSLGMDAAMVAGDWSLRAEAAYTVNRAFNVRQELWGYPQSIATGLTRLPPVEVIRDTFDYGIAGDYRLFEDAILTLQAQQSLILDRPDTLYERAVETILWANLKTGWLNQKVETAVNLACNPEHGASMVKGSVNYVINDAWKIGVIGLLLDGPPQSVFGRYSMNDQVVLEAVYSW